MTTDSPANRRAEARHPVHFEVDCTSGDTFLYAHITDISSMGIFISTDKPLPVGTALQLAFTPRADAGQPTPQRLELTGEVMWSTTGQVAPDKPGMGVRFDHAAPKTRSRLLELVRAIAYLDVTTDIKP
ncbi:TIGR02266 family protein [Nannocystis bainbridge]|uniref:TIGR02266 family protein n=1 Tax=Nannocystis bainbridge TaxID=2995303 RepID=A0ABT5E7J5_9BACT|nr:TIGR02266 family protein [Nannocystis bainbridge]MDC0720797.1 TIGR02266 family protein [Nannocystis bainbridge]